MSYYITGQRAALEKIGAPLGLLTKLLGKVAPTLGRASGAVKQLGTKGVEAFGKLAPGQQAMLKQMGVGAGVGAVPGAIAGGTGENGSFLGALGGGLLGAGLGAAGGRALGKRMQAAVPRSARGAIAPNAAFPNWQGFGRSY